MSKYLFNVFSVRRSLQSGHFISSSEAKTVCAAMFVAGSEL